MRKSTKLKIFRRKKRSVILSVLKRHSLRQHTVPPDTITPCDLEVFPAGGAKTDQGIPVISLPGQARHTLSWESPRLAHTALSISSI